MGQHRPLLLFIFGLFKQTSLQSLQQLYVNKCPSSILYWDSNSWPSEHESPPITTWPGLPPEIFRSLFMAQVVRQITHLLSKKTYVTVQLDSLDLIFFEKPKFIY